MSPYLTAAVSAVRNVLAGHAWPPDVALERARNIAAAALGARALGDEYTEAHARRQLATVREPYCGPIAITDDELHSLAARVVLALSLAEDAA